MKVADIFPGPAPIHHELPALHSFRIERGKYGTNAAMLVEALTKFYAMALDAGQTPAPFSVEFIDESTAQLKITAEYDYEYFVAKLEEI